jgi:hypothetical protein
MKSLKSLNFGANEVLQRNEMKSVLGSGMMLMDLNGNGGGSSVCSIFECNNQFDCDKGQVLCTRCVDHPGGTYKYCV